MALLSMGTVHADKVYRESGGLVVMEIENTDSPLGKWQLIPSGKQGYPTGAVGAGHLECKGGGRWGVPDSPLTYKFRIKKAGKYFLQFRAHKRFEGEKGDKCNDCFVRMAGDFASGSPEIPLKALESDQAVRWCREIMGRCAHA